MPVCRALQQIDYTFYQELPASEVDVEYLWGRLEPLLGYLSPQDRDEVRSALEVGFRCHDGQMRKSGEPFITHPVEVARILAELKMGRECLVAGILHDSVEDTDRITFEGIEELFGQTVRRIVEGETKFSKIGQLADEAGASKVDVKAVDLQQLFLSMTEEVRIIIVKLADRLHNLRTLGSMPPHKQKRIADETLQVFAPLARLLGLYEVKRELEETSFRYSDPDAYNDWKRRVEVTLLEQKPVVEEARRALEESLRKDMYLQMRVARIEVIPAVKSLYSLYCKAKRQQSDGDDGGADQPPPGALGNISQLHVIMHEREGDYDKLMYGNSNQLCYHALGLVHSTWAPIPGKMKDYIATPKSNGYQSLHTTVLPLGSSDLFPLELQIRTAPMQNLAENGIAAEGSTLPFVSCDPVTNACAPLEPGEASKQKGVTELNNLNGSRGPSSSKQSNGHMLPDSTIEMLVESSKWGNVRMNMEVMNRKINWLNSIREWQNEFLDSVSAREFVDTVTGDLLGQRVFVFTPAGELMHLPKGSTVVDFAYHVHTGVGNNMVAAKVNCNLVPPSYELKNAEVVEILTYSAPANKASVERHREWYQYAKTRSARHKLTKFMKDNGHLVNGGEPLDFGSGELCDDESLQQGAGASCRMEDPETSATWLRLEVHDKKGVLAEITSIISRCGHSIKEYSGRFDEERGLFVMKFRLHGDQETIADMCREIGARGFVESWAIGCRLPSCVS